MDTWADQDSGPSVVVLSNVQVEITYSEIPNNLVRRLPAKCTKMLLSVAVSLPEGEGCYVMKGTSLEMLKKNEANQTIV